MTTDDEQRPSAPGAGPEEQPSEEELRARLEEEVRNLRVQDVLLQSVVSVINLAARRINKEDERDLDQARVGIDAARAVVDMLDPEPAEQVRQALSEVQMMYARASDEGGAVGPEDSEPPSEPKPPEREEPPPARDDRASGLWTPPGA